MRFRCPHCRHVLEVDKPSKALLCPACENWCRIPAPKKPAKKDEEVLDVVEVKEKPAKPRRPARRQDPDEVLDVEEVEEPRRPRRESVTDRKPAKRGRDDQEVEDVDFEIVEDGDDRPRKRKRRPRPRRRRSSGGTGIDLDWINPTLILLVVFGLPGLAFCAMMFIFVHPVMGIASLFWVGGSLWFTLIAFEDGWGTALCVLFVPFYSWYYAINNWDRVAIPFLMQLLGNVGMTVSSAMAGRHAGDRHMRADPAPIVVVLASRQQFADGSAPRHQGERTSQPIG